MARKEDLPGVLFPYGWWPKVTGSSEELESLLRRIQEAGEALLRTIDQLNPDRFSTPSSGGDSIKRTLERAVDDINLYYGPLAARALSRPPSPHTHRAELLSLQEARAALEAAHRRFTDLLHDLTPADLDRKTSTEEEGTYTLRQILAMAAAHYQVRAQQLQHLQQALSQREPDPP